MKDITCVLGVLYFAIGVGVVSTHFALQCDSYEIRPNTWEYKSRYEIGYDVATNAVQNTAAEANDGIEATTEANNNEAEPILLLNGFGVGSFHQHRLVPELLTDGDFDVDDMNCPQANSRRRRTVYCIDYLGQGRSWPKDCRDGLGDNERDLQYSADTWCEQIIDFIEAVVLPSRQGRDDNDGNTSGATTPQKKKVHLVGNSVGGHLAAHVAVRRPDLVASLCLLNPTPVWGSKLPGWNGHLPAPAIPKAVGRYLFDRIRDLNTIEQFLTATYSRREAFTDELMHQIRGCTLGDGGHAAFASIMWSPPLVSTTGDGHTTGDFQDCLANVSCDIDVLLVFGKDDPWCKPAFARNMLLALESRNRNSNDSHNSNTNNSSNNNNNNPVHRYVEISNAGHCPNHESPKAVGHLVNQWVDYAYDFESSSSSSTEQEQEEDRSRKNLVLAQAQAQAHSTTSALSFAEEWGENSVRERQRDDIELGWIDKIVTSVM